MSNLRKVKSRVARYNFKNEEIETYYQFVNLLSLFDQTSIYDILEDVMKDANDRKKERLET